MTEKIPLTEYDRLVQQLQRLKEDAIEKRSIGDYTDGIQAAIDFVKSVEPVRGKNEQHVVFDEKNFQLPSWKPSVDAKLLKAKQEKRFARWTSIVLSAAEQGRVPEAIRMIERETREQMVLLEGVEYNGEYGTTFHRSFHANEQEAIAYAESNLITNDLLIGEDAINKWMDDTQGDKEFRTGDWGFVVFHVRKELKE